MENIAKIKAIIKDIDYIYKKLDTQFNQKKDSSKSLDFEKELDKAFEKELIELINDSNKSLDANIKDLNQFSEVKKNLEKFVENPDKNNQLDENSRPLFLKLLGISKYSDKLVDYGNLLKYSTIKYTHIAEKFFQNSIFLDPKNKEENLDEEILEVVNNFIKERNFQAESRRYGVWLMKRTYDDLVQKKNIFDILINLLEFKSISDENDSIEILFIKMKEMNNVDTIDEKIKKKIDENFEDLEKKIEEKLKGYENKMLNDILGRCCSVFEKLSNSFPNILSDNSK